MAVQPRRAYTKAEIDSASSAIKQQLPQLWARWKAHELNNEGYADISGDIRALLKTSGLANTVSEMNALMFELRKQVRIEAGLPTYI